MADLLPVADAATISACEAEYMSLSAKGGGESAEACFRYAWALCHSASEKDNKRGVTLSETAEAFNMEGREGSDITKREFMYIRAVGLFKAGKYTAARTVCNQILEDSPDCRQARSLKAIVEEVMVREGLIGIGVAAAGVATVAIGLIAAFAKKR
mmetsp:Transcript_25565/g.45513  ORF Transcript_25565/g.45513 Transcript_25565/m.45513 type:complete len:155 (-) Transcript_25565:293-757(-)